MGAFRSFILKEMRHILRDRQTLAVLLLMPVAMVLLFGYAIRTDVEAVRTVVVDPSGDARSADLTRAVASTKALRLVGVRASERAARQMLRAGKADVALVLPTDFARRFARGTAEVLVESDGISANYAATSESYVRTVVQGWAAEAGGGAPVVRTATRMRFNPTLESANLFVPGLLAFVLTLVSALMTAISLAKEKETGTLEVLLVSPLRPLQIVVGKVAPYLVLAFINALTALGVAWLVFGVPIRGSLALLLAASLVYVLVSLALGVVHRRARAGPAHGHDGRAPRPPHPDAYALRLRLPDCVHPRLASARDECRAGHVVHHRRARGDAQGRRPDGAVEGSARALRDGRRAARGRGTLL